MRDSYLISTNNCMIVPESDTHPILVNFYRDVEKYSSADLDTENRTYHLLLPYPSPLCDVDNSFKYLFFTRICKQSPKKNQNTSVKFFNFLDETIELELRDGTFIPVNKLNKDLVIRIYGSTTLTITNKFPFNLMFHDVSADPYSETIPPPVYLYEDIDNCYNNFNREMALSLMKNEELINKVISTSIPLVKSASDQDILSKIQYDLSKVSGHILSSSVFKLSPDRYMLRMNYIIFFFITDLYHEKLFSDFKERYKNDDEITFKNMSDNYNNVNFDIHMLDAAASHLSGIGFMKNPAEGFYIISKFYNESIKICPNSAKVSADDVLSVIHDVMIRSRPAWDSLYSSICYIHSIWPLSGLSPADQCMICNCFVAVQSLRSERNSGSSCDNIHRRPTDRKMSEVELELDRLCTK